MRYSDRQNARIREIKSHLCVGLDPRVDLIEGDMLDFLKEVVEQTLPYAAAFKPNIAYFEALGLDGYRMLDELIRWMPKEAPIVLDVKRSDIGETQKAYAKAYFENWDVDAVTLNPFMGYDSLAPFLAYEDKGLFLLGVTSNPDATEIMTQTCGDAGTVFDKVQAMCTRSANEPADAGLVMGLTNLTPEQLNAVVDVPLLIPGMGAQGGSLDDLDFSKRQAPALINSSRSILYGSSDSTFASRAQQATEKIEAVLSHE